MLRMALNRNDGGKKISSFLYSCVWAQTKWWRLLLVIDNSDNFLELYKLHLWFLLPHIRNAAQAIASSYLPIFVFEAEATCDIVCEKAMNWRTE